MADSPHPHDCLFIATRGSALALAQANTVLALCREMFPDRQFALKIIKTTGDIQQTMSLSAGSLPKGLFTKELEVALLSADAALAVHSLKDLPTTLPAGLKLGAVLPREDPRDTLILACPPEGDSWLHLPDHWTVATGSTRRQALLRYFKPHWQFTPIRGNVGTRLNKLAETNAFQATVLAMAGLKRLGYTIDASHRLIGPDVPPNIYAIPLPVEECVPAVGQAAIGIEVAADSVSNRLLDRLNHAATWQCVTAERTFLAAMGGGCHSALGAHATLENNQMRVHGVSFLKSTPVWGTECGPAKEAVNLAHKLANRLNA